MIEQFQYIQNIGRFETVKGTDDTALRRFALIYSENGRGKTTLCAVLRWFQQPVGVVGRGPVRKWCLLVEEHDGWEQEGYLEWMLGPGRDFRADVKQIVRDALAGTYPEAPIRSATE